MAKVKISRKYGTATITVNGNKTVYTAFENSFSKEWYVVEGTRSSGWVVARGIKASSPYAALRQWLNVFDGN